MNYKRKKRILICPLDWGIGHATRCIPIINSLIQKDFEVVIGADNKPLALLQNEYPELEFIKFPSYQINYPSNNQMLFKMLRLMPAILNGIKKEHELLQEIISEKNIDAIISDNRFGVYSNKIPSIYITHQINIKAPKAYAWLEPMLYRLHKHYINKYNRCWIPDYTGKETLAGDLSNKNVPANAAYIGPLSRFGEYKKSQLEKTWPVLAIISGPEPQRNIFQNLVLEKLQHIDKQCLVLAGQPDQKFENQIAPNILLKSHMNSKNLYNAIMNSEVLISRSGYSTIMDLSFTGKKAIFIPTPGQSEQEYLAEYHMKQKNFLSVSQDNFNLNESINLLNNFSGIKKANNNNLLIKEIEKLISLIN